MTLGFQQLFQLFFQRVLGLENRRPPANAVWRLFVPAGIGRIQADTRPTARRPEAAPCPAPRRPEPWQD